MEKEEICGCGHTRKEHILMPRLREDKCIWKLGGKFCKCKKFKIKMVKEKPNKIILVAKSHLVDNEAREWLQTLATKIETINERTKTHTIDYNNIRREIKELKKLINKNEKRA